MPQQNEQYESKESFYHLDICCRMIAEKYGQPAIESWTNNDYLKLSNLLFKQTDVQISPSTLKRIFGKLKTTERYYPQLATRDALVQYAGFKEWEIFVLKHPKQVIQKEKALETTEKKTGESLVSNYKAPLSKSKRRWLWVLIVLPVAAILIIIWQKQNKTFPSQIPAHHAQLVCTESKSGTPHSAIFKLQLAKDFAGDREKLTVDFGDGRTEKKIVAERVLTHIYDFAGRYYALLKYNGKVTDTVSVYAQTNTWTATAVNQFDTTKAYPVKLNRSNTTGKMEVTASEVHSAGVDTGRAFFVHFINTKPLAIDPDNFEVSADVVASQARPGVRCSQVNLVIYGEKSKHEVEFIKPGCIGWTFLQLSEIFKNGEMEDLSFLGTDLTAGGRLKLRVVDKKASILVNEKIVYETTYKFSLGKIYGIKIIFSGIGVVNDFYLKDLKTGQIFNEGFSKIH